jgi:hypothetical protein
VATDTSITPILLTLRQAAESMGFSERKLWDLTAPRGPIQCVRIGRSVRYEPDTLKIYAKEQGSASN